MDLQTIFNALNHIYPQSEEAWEDLHLFPLDRIPVPSLANKILAGK